MFDKVLFFYTTSLAEKPINVVIKKSELQKLAEKCYFISADSKLNTLSFGL